MVYGICLSSYREPWCKGAKKSYICDLIPKVYLSLVRYAWLSSTQIASSFFCSWLYFLNPNILLNYKSIFTVVQVSHAMIFYQNSFAY